MKLDTQASEGQDSDHSFWGDNEQEPTSSETEMSANLCKKCKNEYTQKGRFCENCIQVRSSYQRNNARKLPSFDILLKNTLLKNIPYGRYCE